VFHVGARSRSQPSTPPPVAVEAAAARVYWYRGRDTRPQGPLRMERLRELWLQGGLDAHSLIWCEAWPHWKPVCLVPELADVKPPPRPRTFPPGFSLAAEEQAWLRQLQEVRERVRRAVPSGTLDAEDARPTREMPSVVPSLRSRRGRALLAGALVGPALLGVCLSAVLLVFHPRVPERVLSFMRCVMLWAEGNAVEARPTGSPPVAPAVPAPPAVFAPPAASVAPAAPGPWTDGTASRWKGPGRVVQVSEVRAERASGTGSPQCRGEVPVAMTVSQSLEDRLDKDFVPPEPGAMGRESLTTSDIIQGVIAHKQAVLACIRKHTPPREQEEEKSRVVVSWRVLSGGTVTDVSVEDEALRGSPLAGCLEEQVRSWTFPAHRVASQVPVRFPVTY
jgi:hypothetical protein